MSNQPKRSISVLKRARQSVKRNLRNRAVRTKVRTYIKKLNSAIAKGDAAEVQSALRDAMKVISSAASKGVLHRNTASRYISRLSKKANSVLRSEAA